MDKKDENSPSNLWTRRSKYVHSHNFLLHYLDSTHRTSSNKLSLSMGRPDRNDSRDSHDASSAKRFGPLSSHSKSNPFNSLTSSAVASPTGSGGSSAFGLGSGAFASFGSASKIPKTPGSATDFAKAASGGVETRDGQGLDKDEREKENRRPPARKSLSSLKSSAASGETSASTARDSSVSWPLRHAWVVHYRPPSGKNSDYEKSIQPMCRIGTAQDFFKVYAHLTRPSSLPIVSDYHFFKEGIRPVWEDEENKRGGKWILRLKKGVADRYWEDLLLALIGDQFAEASDEVCGAVVSVRSGEDQISIWTRNDGGRNVKIRETVKRILLLPADTNVQWRSHDESITQRNAADQAKQEKMHSEKRRNTLNAAAAEKSTVEDGKP